MAHYLEMSIRSIVCVEWIHFQVLFYPHQHGLIRKCRKAGEVSNYCDNLNKCVCVYVHISTGRPTFHHVNCSITCGRTRVTAAKLLWYLVDFSCQTSMVHSGFHASLFLRDLEKGNKALNKEENISSFKIQDNFELTV